MDEKPKKPKLMKVTFAGDAPMQVVDEAGLNLPNPSDEQKNIVDVVGKTMRAYLNATKELFKGKYAHLKELAPAHLANPGKVLAACCKDGVVIRFERKIEEERLVSAWMSETLPKITEMLSQNLIHCYNERNYSSTIPEAGIEIKLSSENPQTQRTTDIVKFKIGFDVVIEHPQYLPQPPQKPFCLLSVRNNIELQLVGELVDENNAPGQGQQFLSRTTIRLGAGWDCIEVFPFFDQSQWKPEYAPAWAENDLLAAVVAKQFQETQFDSLDPKASARNQLGQLLKQYKELLDSNPDCEETLQIFLHENSALLCPAKTKIWPKLALGAQKTDFVFQELTGDYLLVELERSTLPLFLKNGDPSSELNHARSQIIDWKRYLEDNLSTVQRELGLSGISSNPKGLIVIGRSELLTPENRRKLSTIENESPKLKIMTYDDVYDNAKAIIENLLGPIFDPAGNTRIYYLANK